ncbi:MAG TPA: TlpA family protein disulfide reductase [Rhizobiales bacterium]|nr:TlpA family protein disulfide reductase [Hyphomicrobiales bacterium]
MTAFVIHKARKDMPQVAFRDKDKKELKLSDWKGRVVLLNLWATWCAPCRREMPHLDRLQGELGGKDFEVVAISVDRKGVKASKKFLDEVGANNLALYVDRSTAVLRTIRAVGLPTTVLIDRNGKEIGRMVGPADWYSPDAIRLIKTAIAEK